jgi:ribosomal protein S18 acetylase RimI-like enzyme
MAEVLPRTRIGSLADLDALAGLMDAYRQFYEQAPDLGRARGYLGERMGRGECVVYVALGADDAVVGFTLLYPTFTSVGLGRIYVLNDLFVAPAARGTRAGVALLEAAKAHARAAGALRLSLRTAHTNARAQGVYERNGWKRDEKFRQYDFVL